MNRRVEHKAIEQTGCLLRLIGSGLPPEYKGWVNQALSSSKMDENIGILPVDFRPVFHPVQYPAALCFP